MGNGGTKKRAIPKYHAFFTAGSRTRTGTRSPPVDFESTASAIPPRRQAVIANNYYTLPQNFILGKYFFEILATFCKIPRLVSLLTPACHLKFQLLVNIIVETEEEKRNSAFKDYHVFSADRIIDYF